MAPHSGRQTYRDAKRLYCYCDRDKYNVFQCRPARFRKDLFECLGKTCIAKFRVGGGGIKLGCANPFWDGQPNGNAQAPCSDYKKEAGFADCCDHSNYCTGLPASSAAKPSDTPNTANASATTPSLVIISHPARGTVDISSQTLHVHNPSQSFRTEPSAPIYSGASWAVILAGVTIPAFFIALIFFACMLYRQKSGRLRRSRYRRTNATAEWDTSSGTSTTLTVSISTSGRDSSCTYACGAARHKALLRPWGELRLSERVGSGRFSEVFLGTFRNQTVAIKSFFPTADSSFQWEKEMCESGMLVHDNVLAFVGAVMFDSGAVIRRFILTEYHPIGDLLQFLETHELTLDRSRCLTLALSASKGVAFLHSPGARHQHPPDVHNNNSYAHAHWLHRFTAGRLSKESSQDNRAPQSTQMVTLTPPKKFPMAHRDIKTKNILVRADLTCCIADFGLVCYNTGDQLHRAASSQLYNVPGTRRYLAPELLDKSMDQDSMSQLQAADIYSLALVLWEVFQAHMFDGEHRPYCQPYTGMVSSDPSWEEMTRIVATRGFRPSLLVDAQRPILGAEVLSNCWKQEPCSRWTADKLVSELSEMMHATDDNCAP